MKSVHMLLCAALLVASVALIATGASAVVLFPFVLCALMMGVMVWMMLGGRSGGGES